MTKYLTEKQIYDYNKIKLPLDRMTFLLKVFYTYEFDCLDNVKQSFIRKEIDKLCLNNQ